MATTKTNVSLWSGQTLTGSTADAALATTVQDLTSAYGACVNIKLTNSGTTNTVPAIVYIQVAGTNSSGAMYSFGGGLRGVTAANAIVSWGGIELPIGVMYVRLLSTSPSSTTSQSVTVDAELMKVTAVG